MDKFKKMLAISVAKGKIVVLQQILDEFKADFIKAAERYNQPMQLPRTKFHELINAKINKLNQEVEAIERFHEKENHGNKRPR